MKRAWRYLNKPALSWTQLAIAGLLAEPVRALLGQLGPWFDGWLL